MSHYICPNEEFYFVSPKDGDCLNMRDAVGTEPFSVTVVVKAPKEATNVTVDGIPASPDPESGLFRVVVPLFGWENNVVAKDEVSGKEIGARFFRLAVKEKSFRLSSDDNILFLKNINDHKDEYRSIFDDPYLSVYKKAHDLYGAKVHLNLFYEFGDAGIRFGNAREPFDLSMMTDKFKDEFKANSDWLKLAFHARTEFPDKPYRNADAGRIRDDACLVNREITRFAGAECIPDTTTVHFGAANPECVRALRSLGYRSLAGYFVHTPSGEPSVAYFYPDDLIDHVGERDFWYDRELDMFYGRIDLVLNCNTHAQNVESIKKIIEHPGRGSFVSVMIHEQYFYPDYMWHLPDFETRVLDICRILHENGYTGCHFSSALREPPLSHR